MSMTVSFILPMFPSTNALNRNVSAEERAMAALHNRTLRGRAKTAVYRAWLKRAGWAMKLQCMPGPLPHISGKFAMKINLPEDWPGDIDNIKALPDLLTRMGVIDDDKCARHLTIDPCRQADTCEIIISGYEDVKPE